MTAYDYLATWRRAPAVHDRAAPRPQPAGAERAKSSACSISIRAISDSPRSISTAPCTRRSSWPRAPPTPRRRCTPKCSTRPRRCRRCARPGLRWSATAARWRCCRDFKQAKAFNDALSARHAAAAAVLRRGSGARLPPRRLGFAHQGLAFAALGANARLHDRRPEPSRARTRRASSHLAVTETAPRLEPGADRRFLFPGSDRALGRLEPQRAAGRQASDAQSRSGQGGAAGRSERSGFRSGEPAVDAVQDDDRIHRRERQPAVAALRPQLPASGRAPSISRGNSLALADPLDRRAGESSSPRRATPTVSPICVTSPWRRRSIVLRDPEGVSESRLGDRSAGASAPSTTPRPRMATPADLTGSERHIVPPRTSVELAERLGMFDDAAGKLRARSRDLRPDQQSRRGQISADRAGCRVRHSQMPIERRRREAPIPYLPDGWRAARRCAICRAAATSTVGTADP